MAERFTEVFRLPKDLYAEGSPVLLEAGVLLKDTVTQRILAQLKFRNLSEKAVRGLLIKFSLMDIGGAVLDPEFEYSYLDLNARKGAEFGSRTPVYLPENNVRKISVLGATVYFADGTSYVAGSLPWAALPAQERIEEHFEQPELRDQWHIELGAYSGFVPSKANGLFRCTCGSVNLDSAEKCYACGRSFEKMLGLLDTSALGALAKERLRLMAEREAARLEQLRQEEERRRLEEEERARLAAEEAEKLRLKKEKRKKLTRRILLIIAAVLLLAFLVYATIWHIIPYVKYLNANKELNAKSFDKAYEIFTGLGTFSDSEARATDTLYQKGLYLIESEEFIAAAETFERIPEYEDSFAKAYYCRNEAAYRAADELLSAGKYLDAADAFLALGNYADSKEKVLKAKYLYAAELLESGEYEKARDAFEELAEYEDSEDQAQEAKYLYAKELLENGEYEKAKDAFDEITKYKDSANQAQEAIYLYAKECLEAGEYDEAIARFKGLMAQKDRKEQVYETIYQKAIELINEKSFDNSNKLLSFISDYKDSSALIHEHNMVGTPTKDPTCTEPGVMTYTCENDGCTYTYTEPIDPTGHSFQDKVSVQPGCETVGELLHICSVCGHTESETLKATGHSYRDTVTTAATCTTNGVRTFTCAACGRSYTETIPAKGHTWTAATCTAPKTCTTCHATEGAALGHTTSTGKCSRCGADFRKTYVFTIPVGETLLAGSEMWNYQWHRYAANLPKDFFSGSYYIRLDAEKGVDVIGYVYDSLDNCMATVNPGKSITLKQPFFRIFVGGKYGPDCTITIGPK